MNSEIMRHKGEVLQVRLDVDPNELAAIVDLLRRVPQSRILRPLTTFEERLVEDLEDLLDEVRQG